MPGPIFTNNAVGTLAAGYDVTATNLTLTAGQGNKFPAPGVGDWFPMTIVDSSNNIEIVHCTARTSDTFTVQRGQEGTLARPLGAGEKVEHRVTAAALAAIMNRAIDPSQIPAGAITTAMLADGAVTSPKIADGQVTGPDLAAGSVSQGKLIPGVAVANLGYTPVQQGGGTGQLGNKIYLGFAPPYVSVQVDNTPLGDLLTYRNAGDPSEAGFRGLPPSVQNNDYTFGLPDAGMMIVHSTGSHVFYIPTTAMVPFQNGTRIKVNNNGGTLTIARPSGGSLIWLPSGVDNVRQINPPGDCWLEKVTGDTWWISGNNIV